MTSSTVPDLSFAALAQNVQRSKLVTEESKHEQGANSKRKKMNEDSLEDLKGVTSIFPEAANLNSIQIGNRPPWGLRQAEESALADNQRLKDLRDVGAKVQHMHEKVDAWAMTMLSKGLDESFRDPTPLESEYLDWCEEQKTQVTAEKGKTTTLGIRRTNRTMPGKWLSTSIDTTLRRLVLYANDAWNKPILFTQFYDFMSTCDSCCATEALYSDITSTIAPKLQDLMNRILIEGSKSSTKECEFAIHLINDFNELLQNEYHWNPDAHSFNGPFDLTKFSNELMAASRIYLNSKIHKMIWKNWEGNSAEAATKDKGNVLPHGHRPQETVYEAMNVMRQMIEEAFSKPEQSDVLDSIWSDDEEQDEFDTDSESENTENDRYPFDTASEVSGADVTDSDWSVIN